MLLEIENLSITFQTRRGPLEAVRDISFSLDEGETLGVVGESGCGKSLTNLAIMGLLPSQAKLKANKLQFLNHDLLKLKEKFFRQLRGNQLAMIFQDPMSALNPSFTIGFQLMEILKIHGERNSKRRYQRALELLDEVGLPAAEERMKSFPHELSGGMCQRVMLAMSVALNPKLLIADEPTTALDVTIQAQILALLKRLQKEHHMALLLVTHDLAVVAQMADKVQVMYAGEVVERGKTQEIINSPKHPYTKGLISSLPGQNINLSRKQKLSPIPGLVPDLVNRPSGCQLHPRCPYKMQNCENNDPLLEEINGHHFVRCFHPLNIESSLNVER